MAGAPRREGLPPGARPLTERGLALQPWGLARRAPGCPGPWPSPSFRTRSHARGEHAGQGCRGAGEEGPEGGQEPEHSGWGVRAEGGGARAGGEARRALSAAGDRHRALGGPQSRHSSPSAQAGASEGGDPPIRSARLRNRAEEAQASLAVAQEGRRRGAGARAGAAHERLSPRALQGGEEWVGQATRDGREVGASSVGREDCEAQVEIPAGRVNDG